MRASKPIAVDYDRNDRTLRQMAKRRTRRLYWPERRPKRKWAGAVIMVAGVGLMWWLL